MWVLAVCCGLVLPECVSGGPILRYLGGGLRVHSPCVVPGHHWSHKAGDLVFVALFLFRIFCGCPAFFYVLCFSIIYIIWMSCIFLSMFVFLTNLYYWVVMHFSN